MGLVERYIADNLYYRWRVHHRYQCVWRRRQPHRDGRYPSLSNRLWLRFSPTIQTLRVLHLRGFVEQHSPRLIDVVAIVLASNIRRAIASDRVNLMDLLLATEYLASSQSRRMVLSSINCTYSCVREESSAHPPQGVTYQAPAIPTEEL